MTFVGDPDVRVGLTSGYLHVTFGFVRNPVVATYFLEPFVFPFLSTQRNRESKASVGGTHLNRKAATDGNFLDVQDAFLVPFTLNVMARIRGGNRVSM